ncbi:hypothetical protein Glove_341g15 [Diversispora epigaea]|uniref:BTB domain-containing protein n=1 Tax=Diversispora epigaea TaxID=1348612 RepID=A0A397HJH0_9GLOM|nr:hypothetical protein Glove_341g15 [Diversispora epigaea]
MSTFYNQLSENFGSLLETEINHDVIIQVGKFPNQKQFKVHSLILSVRSPYFNLLFSKIDSLQKNDNGIIIINKPDNTPLSYEIILRYLYMGVIDFEKLSFITILDLSSVVVDLNLNELIIFIQPFLLEKRFELFNEYIIEILNTFYNNKIYTKLSKFCDTYINSNSHQILNSGNFKFLSKNILLLILKFDYIKGFTEIELWNKLIEWGKAQIQDEIEGGGEDIMNWSKDDFNNLEEILHDLIPLIRFFQIFSDDFYKFVYPYKRVLPKVLRKDLVAYYITSYYAPASDVLPARKTQSDDINSTTSDDTRITETQNYKTPSISSMIQDSIYSSDSPDLTKSSIHSDSSTYSEDSSILSEEAKTLLENWINESEKSSWTNYLHIGKTTIQKWRWNLLYRASWNGYSPVKFHQECDNKGSCVIVVKIKNEPNKVIGGYNPVGWYKLKRGCIKYSPTKSSFIYHLDEMDLDNNSILCRVKQNKHQTAICQTNSFGPTFGYFDHNEFFVSKIIKSHCHTGITYQSGIDIGSFEVEDYEVFQLVKE